MKKIFILILSCALLASCGKGAEITCAVAVNADGYTVIEETSVILREGQTALDILKTVTRDAGVQMEYTGAGVYAYVKGIDNLYEFDKGPESGWIYSVNGETPDESAGTFTLSDGDAVIWQYVITQ